MLLMNEEFSCSYGIFSIPSHAIREEFSRSGESAVYIHLTSIVVSIVYPPISAYHCEDAIHLRVTSLEPNLLDSTASMALSRANAAGMSLKTGAVISSLPYIPGKYAIATADIFVNIPAMLSLSCAASATKSHGRFVICPSCSMLVRFSSI